jgi:hypothetical protein
MYFSDFLNLTFSDWDSIFLIFWLRMQIDIDRMILQNNFKIHLDIKLSFP